MADFPEPSSPSSSQISNITTQSYPFPRPSSSSTRGNRTSSILIHNGPNHRRQSSLSPEIVAPTPRRDLLESTASQSWLNTPPYSPASSRPVSPTSTRALSRSPTARVLLSQQSFSSLLEQKRTSRTLGAVKEDDARSISESGMGRRWVRWTHKHGLKDWVAGTAFLTSVLIKFCIGLGSYSGENTPPMYGDYEAQRHWMELTIHLPTSRWYTYDLQYWGLDYPLLTAYVSWLCGIVAHQINPSWVALDSSRGIETPGSKLFMRSSVIILDALIYVPAIFMFTRTWLSSRSKRTQNVALLFLLLHPALLLIDFGHFQYNSVMLGFTIMALNLFATGHDLLGAVSFVLSLGFKQMAIYYAPAIGSYLLAKCVLLGPKDGTKHLVRLGLTTIAAFVLLFLPWLPPFASVSPSVTPLSSTSDSVPDVRLAIMQPITRIFPFSRGLFEDKVANFWCASNVVMKWKKWVTQVILVRASAALTLLGFLPGVVALGRTGWGLRTWGQLSQSSKQSVNESAAPPTETDSSNTTISILPLLPYALLNSSMSFFLFSFQVHEKTILLPLMPLTLLLCGAAHDSAAFAWGAIGSNVAVFSMWPLLKKDNLGLQYIALMMMWNRLIGHNPFKSLFPKIPIRSFTQLFSTGVYAAIAGLHLLEIIITPPERYPDLFPVLNVLISTPVFVCIWVWSIVCCVQVSWAISGLSGSGQSSSSLDVRPPRERVASAISEAAGETSWSSSAREGIGRSAGARAVSLGYAQGRRTKRSSTQAYATSSSTAIYRSERTRAMSFNASGTDVGEGVRS